MFETYALMIILAAVPIIRTNGAFGLTDARDAMLFAMCGLLFAGLCFAGLPGIGTLQAELLLLFMLYYSLTCFWSDLPAAAMRELPRWWAGTLLFLCMPLVRHDLVLMALFVPAVLHVAQGISHQFFCRDFLCKDIDLYLQHHKKALRFYGFLGNNNYNGAFFVPLFFIGLHLVVNLSPWWALVEIPVMAGIILTRCRASWVSVVAGFAVFPAAWPVIAIGALLFFFIGIRRPEPILGRYFYVRFAWMIWLKRPLFGWGPRVFRRKIFRAQADANQKDKTLLGNPDTPGRIPDPKGEWAHNEYLDILMEAGILGLALFVLFGGSVLQAAFQGPAGNLFLLSGFIAMLVNAMFFYNLRLAATSLPFWVLGGILSAPGQMGLPGASLPLYWATPAAAVALYLVYHFAGKWLVAQVLSYRAMKAQDKELQFRNALAATRWAPKHNTFLSNLALILQYRDPAAGMNACEAMLQHFDGEKAEWAICDQYGRMATVNRAYLVARSAFMTALYLNPSYMPAWQGLSQVEKVLADIAETIKQNQSRIAKPDMKAVRKFGKAR